MLDVGKLEVGKLEVGELEVGEPNYHRGTNFALKKTRDPYLAFPRSLLLWTPRYTESSEGF